MTGSVRLSRPLIVSTALELVERDGVDALTMRALARALGADPMAIYRHVRDKQALLGAMCDAVLADVPPLAPDEPWRPQLERLARRLYDELAARPSLALVMAKAPMTPASVALAQQVIALMSEQDVPVETAVTGLATVFVYVIGLASTVGIACDQDGLALRREALHHLGDPDTAPPFLDEALGLLDAPDIGPGLALVLDGLERRCSP